MLLSIWLMSTRAILLTMLLAWPVAAEGQRSSYRVAGNPRISGSRLKIKLAYANPGGSSRVEFFAHHKVPSHVSQRVHAGLGLGSKTMCDGKGMCTLDVDLARLKKAGFKPGDRLFIAADWPGIRHLWGTTGDGRPGHHAGTSFVIPDLKKSKGKRRRSAIPPVPKLPKTPSINDLLRR